MPWWFYKNNCIIGQDFTMHSMLYFRKQKAYTLNNQSLKKLSKSFESSSSKEQVCLKTAYDNYHCYLWIFHDFIVIQLFFIMSLLCHMHVPHSLFVYLLLFSQWSIWYLITGVTEIIWLVWLLNFCKTFSAAITVKLL